MTNQNNGWGGSRPGSGRKSGLGSGQVKEARTLSLPYALWQRLEEEQQKRGLTRTALCEKALSQWLDEHGL